MTDSDRIAYLERRVAELEIGHNRYEVARRMNPRQWADAWQLNVSTGKPFDEIIDDLRPFYIACQSTPIRTDEVTCTGEMK